MVEKREIVCRYVSQGLIISVATAIAGIKRSTYYYRPNGKPKGKQPSTHTLKYNECPVRNEVVVDDIIDLISPEYNDYGYQTVSELLKQKGYIINHKKVRRLMRDYNLLHPKTVKYIPGNKTYIQFTVPPLIAPYDTVEADIKYVYIHGEKRNAFLLTFLCTFSRHAPIWCLDYSMKSSQIISMVNSLLDHYIVKKYIVRGKTKVNIRTDNGPQFIAKILAEALDKLQIKHEFIQPGTPQQNGHIESFHNTVTRLVCNRNIFLDIIHAREIFAGFYYAYNNTRAMKALLYYPPVKFLSFWKAGLIGIKRDKNGKERFFFSGKPASLIKAGSSPEELFEINESNIFELSVLKTKEISPVL
jgi:putative transposase